LSVIPGLSGIDASFLQQPKDMCIAAKRELQILHGSHSFKKHNIQNALTISRREMPSILLF
jgi:hypothetical protein